MLKGYNSVRTFSKAQQEAFAEKYLAEHPQTAAKPGPKDPETFAVPRGYDERFDHFVNFFKSVREQQAGVRGRHLRLPRRGPGAALQRELPPGSVARLGPGPDAAGVVTRVDRANGPELADPRSRLLLPRESPARLEWMP